MKTSSIVLRVVAVALAATVLACLFAGSAGAATFAGNRLQLALAPTFKKSLKSGHVKLSGTSGASLSGSTLTLPITSGQATLAAPFTGSLTLTGGIRFKGKKTLTLKNLSELLSGTTAALKSGSTRYFGQATTGHLKASSDFTELDASGVPTKLTGPGAKALNSKLKVKFFKKNQTVGKLRFVALRRLAVTGGNTQVQLDPNTQSKLASCGIGISAISPATQSGSTINLPLASGVLDAKSLFGLVTQAGGIHLQSPKHQSDLTVIQLSIVATGGGATALASDQNGARTPIGDLNVAPASFAKNLTPTNGTATINGVVLNLNSQAALLVQALYGCSAVKAGDPLGTLGIAANVT